MPSYAGSRAYQLASPYLNQLITPGFQVGGITVDNPTNVWWLIPETGDIIPPYTMGWSKNFRPPIASFNLNNSLTVTAISVASSIGKLSTYEYITNADDLTVAEDTGGRIGLATIQDIADLETAVANVQTSVNSLTGGFGAATSGWSLGGTSAVVGAAGTIIASPGATKTLVLTSWKAAWVPSGGEPRGFVVVQIASNTTLFAHEVLTPERMSAGDIFAPKAVTVGINKALQFDFSGGLHAASTDQIRVYGYYYIQ